MRFLKRALEAFLILLGLVVLLMQLGPDSDTDEDVDKQLGRGHSPSAAPARPAAAPLQRSSPLAAAGPVG
jgi:hypothetical protein